MASKKVDLIINRIKILRSKRFDLSTKKGISDMNTNSRKIRELENKLIKLTYKN